MDLNELMNDILLNACPSEVLREGDKMSNNGQVATYWVETHCVGWMVTAELVKAKGKTTYKILEVTSKNV